LRCKILSGTWRAPLNNLTAQRASNLARYERKPLPLLRGSCGPVRSTFQTCFLNCKCNRPFRNCCLMAESLHFNMPALLYINEPSTKLRGCSRVLLDLFILFTTLQDCAYGCWPQCKIRKRLTAQKSLKQGNPKLQGFDRIKDSPEVHIDQ